MPFIGQYTRGETVRVWAHFINLAGVATEPTTATVELRQGATVLLAETAMTQLTAGSNIFFRDYAVGLSPTEGDVFAIYRGTIEGEIAEGHDFFKIDFTKTHVLENRLGNTRIRFIEAVVIDNVRNVDIGQLDHQILETKHDSDPADWSVIRFSKTMWFHYETLSDLNPVKVGEDS